MQLLLGVKVSHLHKRGNGNVVGVEENCRDYAPYINGNYIGHASFCTSLQNQQSLGEADL